MNILVLNCGSSSLKYRLYSMPDETERLSGEAQRVGIRTSGSSVIIHTENGTTRTIETKLPDHRTAFAEVMKIVGEGSIDCIAHRYVHPGRFFSKTTRVDDSVRSLLVKTLRLAPIHNPIAQSLVDACADMFAGLPQYLVFDSAFHARMPDELAVYAIPERLTKGYGIRRTGFHGISHEYAMHEACGFLSMNTETTRIVSCHLVTGGASVCAIRDGRSIASSMGFTPLEGLIMNTRTGDIDIGLLFYVMYLNDLSAVEAEKLCNNASGVIALSETTSDMRDIIRRAGEDDGAENILESYVRRIKKYVGFYLLLLKKADIIIFTDTLGQDEPVIRERVCRGFEYIGVRIDPERNRSPVRETTRIDADDSETRILVVPANEELMIAREAYREAAHGIGH